MWKKLMVSICFLSVFAICLDYDIVLDKLINLKDGKYFVQFYPTKNKEIIFMNCSVNGDYLGFKDIFRKTVYINGSILRIECSLGNTKIKKIIFVNNIYDTPYNITILNPDKINYDSLNKFDVFYPDKRCVIKLVIDDKPYNMNKTIYGFYTKTVYIKRGDNIKFLVVCSNKKYLFNYSSYKYNNIENYKIVTSDIPNLTEETYLLLKFYILDKYGHRKYDQGNISYSLYDSNGNEIPCNLNKEDILFSLKCYLNKSGEYKLNLCYKNVCIKKNITVSKKVNTSEYGLKIISPDENVVYNVNRKKLLFRIFVKGEPIKVFENKTGIVFKNVSKHIYLAKLPITLGENKFNVVVLYKDRMVNRSITVFTSDKIPTITILCNNTYKVNKSDKIKIFVDVKYKNKTLETGDVLAYITCDGISFQDRAKFDYENEKYVIYFYASSGGECSIKVKYLNKNYVTVEKTKNFKVEIDQNYSYDLQITNALIIAILIVFTAIIIVIILKSVL